MSPKHERLPIVVLLRAYFDATAVLGPWPTEIHLWPEQMDLLLKHTLAEPESWHVPLAQQNYTLKIDGLPATRLIRYVEIYERVTDPA